MAMTRLGSLTLLRAVPLHSSTARTLRTTLFIIFNGLEDETSSAATCATCKRRKLKIAGKYLFRRCQKAGRSFSPKMFPRQQCSPGSSGRLQHLARPHQIFQVTATKVAGERQRKEKRRMAKVLFVVWVAHRIINKPQTRRHNT